jgi:hypothetical protein
VGPKVVPGSLVVPVEDSPCVVLDVDDVPSLAGVHRREAHTRPGPQSLSSMQKQFSPPTQSPVSAGVADESWPGPGLHAPATATPTPNPRLQKYRGIRVTPGSIPEGHRNNQCSVPRTDGPLSPLNRVRTSAPS